MRGHVSTWPQRHYPDAWTCRRPWASWTCQTDLPWASGTCLTWAWPWRTWPWARLRGPEHPLLSGRP
jgi:hypothetical protein